MEVKVYVEGVQRIVCGVTEKTTCQEVVIALARALGRTGRYTLREKFKEYERNVTPDERLLESLEKYGEQAKEVQLTLKHIGPSLGEETSQPKAQMRRAEGGGRARRGSGGIALHRQSLPPLSRLCLHSEPPPEEPKRPKRKSLTLMEEAWGWLENLGKGGRPQLGQDKGKEGNEYSDKASPKQTKSTLVSGALQGKDKKDKNRVTLHQPLISCLGKRGRCNDEYGMSVRKEEVIRKDTEELKTITTGKAMIPQIPKTESEEIVELRRLIIQQQASLKNLKLKIESTDQLISELEEQQDSRQSFESLLEEEEQIEFWMNELKAEEGHERDLQRQFFQIKEEAAKCKAKLEEYKQKCQAMDLRHTLQLQMGHLHENATGQNSQVDTPNPVLQHADPSIKQTPMSADVLHGDNGSKSVVTTLESKLPYVFVSANQISHPPSSGPADLREWWTRWSQSQNPSKGTKPKVVHRSEITIHLGSTRV